MDPRNCCCPKTQTQNVSQVSPTSCSNVSVTSETLGTCPSTPVVTPPLPARSTLIKVPVVLAEITVQSTFEARITLQQPAIDIKRIKKNVFIKQCKLLRVPGPTPYSTPTFKLFLRGFVRKNIEYSTLGCVAPNGVGVAGNIAHTTVDVPFSCLTIIPATSFLAFPELVFNAQTLEAQVVDTCILGKDRAEEIFITNEVFNEKVFCEPIADTITEIDRAECLIPVAGSNEFVFRTFTEKISVDLTLKLLQLQQRLVATTPFVTAAAECYEDPQ